MGWTWDPRKDRRNQADHGVSFATAELVFDDPLAASQEDQDPDEQRWITIGVVGGVTIVVVHTSPDGSGEEGRIISARKATAHERKAYEEGAS